MFKKKVHNKTLFGAPFTGSKSCLHILGKKSYCIIITNTLPPKGIMRSNCIV